MTGQVEWDERTQKFYDFPTRRHAVADVLPMIFPEDQIHRDEAVRVAVQPDHPQPYFVEYRVRHHDGNLRWLQIKGQATFAGEGAARRAVSMNGTVADVTETKAAQAALRERGQIPPTGRRDAADRLGRPTRRGPGLHEPALVRVSRHPTRAAGAERPSPRQRARRAHRTPSSKTSST